MFELDSVFFSIHPSHLRHNPARQPGHFCIVHWVSVDNASSDYLVQIAEVLHDEHAMIGAVLIHRGMLLAVPHTTAVNDTSSVVAAGFAFSETAGDYATMVKLTRTLAIIPTVIIFALINMRLKKKAALADSNEKINVNIKAIFPWFILGFLALSAINSLGVIPAEVSASLKSVSKFLMVAALAAIGLNTSFKDMRKAGPAPMLHGFFISALVVIVAIAVILFEKTSEML